MLRLFSLALLTSILHLPVGAQVRPEYLYNANMPYGKLDIRTSISETEFYFLEEGKTFSFRESAPGVRSNTFLDMTSWDSKPYKEGNLRKKNGNKSDFILNYRLLQPLNYDASHSEGYPLIVLMHGAVERGNCFYDDCYHADWNYDPSINSPPAPTNADHKLLNNDHQLIMGGRQHLAARDRAGNRLPGDPSMPSDAFPGFVLIPQMLNVWDSLTVEDVIRLVRLHCEKYEIDQNRIYIHGLSIGGYATYEAIKRAPWLFAAALPMSAVTEAADIFKDRQQDNVVHIPIWIFQGGLDKRPSPEFTQTVVDKFKSAGAAIRYTVYPALGHRVWDSAYDEPEFFSWMLGESKTDLHARWKITHIDTAKNVYPQLMLAAGFFGYQWEKDGLIITGETSNTLTVKAPGIYRARFTRSPESAGAGGWNPWSAPVTITGDEPGDPGDAGGEDPGESDGGAGDGTGEGDGATDDGAGDGVGEGDGGTDDGAGEGDGGTDDGIGDGAGDGDTGEDAGAGEGEVGTDDGGADVGAGGGEDGSGPDDGAVDDGTGGDSGEDTGEGEGTTGDGGADDGADDGTGADDGASEDGAGGDSGEGTGEVVGDTGDGGADDGAGDGSSTDDGVGEGDGGIGNGPEVDDGSSNDGGGDGFGDGDGTYTSDDPEGETITGIEHGNAFTVSVYPNPAPGREINIHLSAFNGGELTVKLVDMLGHILYDRKYAEGDLSNNSDINISLPLHDGVYILILRDAARELKQRVMINNSN